MKNYIKDYILSRVRYPIFFIGGYMIVYFITATILSYTNLAPLEQAIVTSFMPALVYFLVMLFYAVRKDYQYWKKDQQGKEEGGE